MTLTMGSLCTGAGGYDLAISDVLGEMRRRWVAETDKHAARVLARRLPAPNLGDIQQVDWSAAPPVDVLAAGYPCQDFSNAGKRAGLEGSRGALWFHVAAAISALRPRLVLLENVDAHVVRGFPRVLADLATLGYDATWATVRASDIGAPHRRERLFVVASPADAGGEYLRLQPVTLGARRGPAVSGDHRPRALMPTPVARDHKGAGYRGQLGTVLLPTPTANATGAGSQGREGGLNLQSAIPLLPTPNATDAEGGARRPPAKRTHSGRDFGPRLRDIAPLLPTPTAADAERVSHTYVRGNPTLVGAMTRWAQYGPAIARWERVLGRPAPEPTVTGKRGGQRLSARFVEWLMGWPDGWVSDLVPNTDALRICGNGVVRQQGAAALRGLLARHFSSLEEAS